MRNHYKLAQIMGLISDYKERLYFSASTNCTENWDEEGQNSEAEKCIESIKEILEKN